MNLGACCVQLGRFERADECLRQALAADDQQCDAWVAWGVTQMALGQWPQALHSHEQARALGADGADFCLRWGQCLAYAGQLPQAVQAFDQALAHAPQLAEAWSVTWARPLQRSRVISKHWRSGLTRSCTAITCLL
jgi:superkiller protein 3